MSNQGSLTAPPSVDFELDQQLLFPVEYFMPRQASTAGGEQVAIFGGWRRRAGHVKDGCISQGSGITSDRACQRRRAGR
jgi:hypothetical protein